MSGMKEMAQILQAFKMKNVARVYADKEGVKFSIYNKETQKSDNLLASFPAFFEFLQAQAECKSLVLDIMF